MKLDYEVSSLNELKTSGRRHGGVFSSKPDIQSIKRAKAGVPTNLLGKTMTTKSTSSNMSLTSRQGVSHNNNSIAVMTSNKARKSRAKEEGWSPNNTIGLALQKTRKALSNNDRLDYVANAIHSTSYQNLTPNDKQAIHKIAFNEDAIANMQAQQANTPKVQGMFKTPQNQQPQPQQGQGGNNES